MQFLHRGVAGLPGGGGRAAGVGGLPVQRRVDLYRLLPHHGPRRRPRQGRRVVW